VVKDSLAAAHHFQLPSSCQVVECTPFRSSSQPGGTTAAFPAEADRCSLSTKLPTALSLAMPMFMLCMSCFRASLQKHWGWVRKETTWTVAPHG
jgi:hypothetical protein